jgi:hypothetical protein
MEPCRVLVFRPHIESQGARLWSALLHFGYRAAHALRARCEAIVDAMFDFDLRREEIERLTHRRHKR